MLYDSAVSGWDATKKVALLAALQVLSSEFEAGARPSPLVEGTTFGKGVLIRRLMYLTDLQREDLMKRADQIYVEVMGITEGVHLRGLISSVRG